VRFVACFVVFAFAALVTAVSCLPDLTLAPATGQCGSGVVNLDDGEACDPGDAGALGCTTSCQIQCEGGVIDDATSHCYFWTPPVLSLDMAVQTCGNLNAHPVSFVDMTELSFIATATKGLPNASNGASWLALEKGLVNEAGLETYYTPLITPLPGWASSCIGCFAYTDASDIPLPGTGIPAPCVNWRHSLTSPWTQGGCTLGVTDAGQTTNNVLCEREPPGIFSMPCESDASAASTCIEVPMTHTTKRYELAAVPAIFDIARSTCSTRGGQLVRFDTAAEREEVVTEVRRVTNADFWIGLFYDTTKTAWSWVDGTLAPYASPTPWADLEPSMSADGFAAAIHSEQGSFTTHLARAQDATTVLLYMCQFAK